MAKKTTGKLKTNAKTGKVTQKVGGKKISLKKMTTIAKKKMKAGKVSSTENSLIKKKIKKY